LVVASEIHARNVPARPRLVALSWQRASAAVTLPTAPEYVVDVTNTCLREELGSGIGADGADGVAELDAPPEELDELEEDDELDDEQPLPPLLPWLPL
jgi:hypothetical protein